MKFNFKKLLPTPFELITLIFVDLLIIFLGNSKQLLSYYGLDSSNQILQNKAGSAISHGLSKLDNFSITAGIVTFAVWAVVGVFCLSIVQVITSVYSNFERDEALSSDRYVHPLSFTRVKFWRQVFWEFIVVLLLLVITGLVLYGFVAFALPIGLAYRRTFLLGISLPSVGSLLIGFAAVYVGLVMLDGCLHLLAHRRQFTRVM